MILGLDVSTKWIGWAVYNEALQRVESSGQQQLDGDGTARLSMACLLLKELPEMRWVTHVAIEQPFAGPNRKTTMVLGQIWGAMTLMIHLCEKVRLDITPAEGKLAATGRGNADKALMQQMVKAQFPGVSGEHACDAVGVALAAAGKIKMRALEVTP